MPRKPSNIKAFRGFYTKTRSTVIKSLKPLKFIYKIHSERLRRAKWDLILPIGDARRSEEIVSIADSQVLRWIDELNCMPDVDDIIRSDYDRIHELRTMPPTVKVRHEVAKLYRELDDLQLRADYMCLIIDTTKDYYRACKGFSINGITYKRLLGTVNGIKNSTIVFVNEKLHAELERRIENNRDTTKPYVTAKLEAYRALTCSAAAPVSLPNGVLIVKDFSTAFKSDISYLTDEGEGEPTLTPIHDQTINLDACDGCGIMLPSLAERWSRELGLDYTACGMNTRFAYEKGMVFTFDFIDFADQIAGSYIVNDAWGNEVDIRDIELILTTSMVKLWDGYESCEDYLTKSLSNNYSFGISKVCPKTLDNKRALNYQFIQSYDLSDDDIDELINPTVTEFKDVLGNDRSKAVLFMKGLGLNSRNIQNQPDDYIKALMIDERMMNDPYVRKSIYDTIKNRINQAKVGVINVHGNFSIVSGDPYALCQSIFGMEVTGLLGAGEIYNLFWYGAGDLVCYRAPMTCHANIRRVKPNTSNEALYWYQYMSACTIFNCWDTASSALNGMDYDGDLVFLTDNPVLLKKHKPLPSLMCAQRQASKCISTEEDFVKSNIASFGNEIGQTTNWITSMFEVRDRFDCGSEEYKVLSYRIQCGQLYQQNAIDKAKGITCKPMPGAWHNRHAVKAIKDDNKRAFYSSIVADRKPYFMRYIYPSLAKQYKEFVKNISKNSLRRFGISYDDLKALPDDELSDSQRSFLKGCERDMPVGTSDCVMNRICRRFEREFDEYIKNYNCSADFDYRFMRNDSEYAPNQFNAIKRLYGEYNSRLKNLAAYSDIERIDKDEISSAMAEIVGEFKEECTIVCPNKYVLCNILLDMCYTRQETKSFVWQMCGDTICEHLFAINNNTICYPTMDDSGDIEYCGKRFRLEKAEVNAND